jgi:molybdopterin-guanine dinucleotide biosynthesis protein A
VVLAGGLASRFAGAPKGLREVGGTRIVDRVLAALRDASDALLVIANDADAGGWFAGVEVRADVRSERGSLIGIHSALVHAGQPVLVVAWDMPFVPAELLVALRALGEAHEAPAVPESDRGLEPLCAYYPLTSLPAIERQIERGTLRLRDVLESLPHRAVLRRDEVARFGDPQLIFLNVNSPEDLDTAQRAASRERMLP